MNEFYDFIGQWLFEMLPSWLELDVSLREHGFCYSPRKTEDLFFLISSIRSFIRIGKLIFTTNTQNNFPYLEQLNIFRTTCFRCLFPVEICFKLNNELR